MKRSFGMKNKQNNYFKYFHFITFLLKSQILHELPFYNELSVVEISEAFKRSFSSVRS